VSERDGSGQAGRYCTNCGAEIRPGTRFCMSCGEPLDLAAQENLIQAPATPSNRQGDTQRESSQQESFGEALRTVMADIFGYAKTLADPPKTTVFLLGLGSLMGLLLLLSPLVFPVLDFFGPTAFYVPLLVFAISILTLLLSGEGWARGASVRRIAVVALVVYLMVGLYRVFLMYFEASESRIAMGVLLLVVVAVGVLFVLNDRGILGRPQENAESAGDTLRGLLHGGIRSARTLPRGLKILVVGAASLVLIASISPYVFVLGGALVAMGVVALVIRALQSRPLKRTGAASVAFVALTVIFGVISNGLYGTGTGLTMGIASGSEAAQGSPKHVGSKRPPSGDRARDEQTPSDASTVQSSTYSLGTLPSDYPIPEYEMIDYSEGDGDYGVVSFDAAIAVDSYDEKNLMAIAEYIAGKQSTGGYHIGTILVYPADLQPYDELPGQASPIMSGIDGAMITITEISTIFVDYQKDEYQIVRPKQ
jgi:hypothetical protein